MHRTYVDYMPVYWVIGDVLPFPPEGKSENVSQTVNIATWHQCDITKLYWDTKAMVIKEAEQKANKIRSKE